jgi:hypothetical protein
MTGGGAEYDRDTQHPLAAPNYAYGNRRDELAHAHRELEQYQLALSRGDITQSEYRRGVARVRRRRGLLGWGSTHRGP